MPYSTRSLLHYWLLVLFLLMGISGQAQTTISLRGEWNFRMDPTDAGITQQWFATPLPGRITLPGSMLDNGLGNPVTLQTKWTGSIYDSSWYFVPRLAKYRRPDYPQFAFWLTPKKVYTGAAWYQKAVTIPAAWRKQRVVLYLERAHTQTRVWVDNTEVGAAQNSLVAPHEYDLSAQLTPGPHTLTVRIDNRLAVAEVGQDSNSLTDHTQGNWNGLIGELALRATPPVWIDEVQIYPDVAHQLARVKLTVKNSTGRPATAQLALTARSFNAGQPHTPAPVGQRVRLAGPETTIDLSYPLGSSMQLWDEFSPALYQLTATLDTRKYGAHTTKTQFGMRDFGISGTRFTINGRPVFLRGTVNNCEFPLTGHPPTDTAAWLRIFRIARAHGLNHMRFHSWCPPAAAFVAADQVGFYLQPEGPTWANHGTSLGDGRFIDQYVYDETNRMARYYGNYASYCMLSSGNEPAGRKQAQYLAEFIKYWQEKDSRRKYTGASVAMSWPLVPTNEYMIKSGARGWAGTSARKARATTAQKLPAFPCPTSPTKWASTACFPTSTKFRNTPATTSPATSRCFGRICRTTTWAIRPPTSCWPRVSCRRCATRPKSRKPCARPASRASSCWA